MKNKGIYIFLGPPFSGKETQTIPLSLELEIPVFSMGGLIRKAKEVDTDINSAFEEFTTKGLHVPTNIKFELLSREMDRNPQGFILDNFPATQDDLLAFDSYNRKNNMEVNKVYYLNIGHEEMIKRFQQNPDRGRADDTIETLETRSRVQSEDRVPVLEYFKARGKLVEINGEQSIEAVYSEIRSNL